MGFKRALSMLDKKNKWWPVQKRLRRQDSRNHLGYLYTKSKSQGFKGKGPEDIIVLAS